MNRERQSRRAAEEASAWLARLDSGAATDADRQAHERWLAASSVNRDEYAAVSAVFARAGQIVDRSLLELAEEPPRSWWSFAASAPTPRAAWAGALAVVASVMLGIYWFAIHSPAQVFTTGVGETRAVTLADGSIVTLNTDSALRVPKWDATRRVELERGEAFFAVKRAPNAPFVVSAGGGTVRVLGTQFNVRLNPSGATVAIVEGRVELTLPAPAHTGATREILVAGQAAAYDEDSLLQEDPPPVARLTAWRDGKLVFDDTKLEDVVREVNRYSSEKVRIADATLNELRITGTFATDRIPHLLQTLEKAAPIRMIERDDTILIVAR